MNSTVTLWPRKTREMHNHHFDSTIWNDFRFRLDVSQLPRPFQIGVANQPEWNLQREGELALPAVLATEQVRSEDTVSGEPFGDGAADAAGRGK